MSINIILLAGNKGNKSEYPLLLTEINGKTLLEKIVSSLKKFENSKFTLVVDKNSTTKFHVDKIMKLLIPEAKTISIQNDTKGSACSALLAASTLNLENQLLIISTNEIVNIDLFDIICHFIENKYDAGTICFKSYHPRYSFVKLDKNNLVIEAAQQNPISEFATAGIFWYSKTLDFINGAKNQIKKGFEINDKYYIAPIFNELLLEMKKIGVYEISPDLYIPIKDEVQERKIN